MFIRGIPWDTVEYRGKVAVGAVGALRQSTRERLILRPKIRPSLSCLKRLNIA